MKPGKKVLYTMSVLLILGFIFVIASYRIFEDSKTLESGKTQEKTEIRFISSWGGIDTKAWQMQQVLDAFEKENPNVKIVNDSMSGEEFLFKLKTNFAQGNDPDVFGLWPGSDIITLIQKDRVADLTQLLKEDKKWADSFGQDAWSYDTFNGKIYGLPCEIIYECLFINRDLFEKYEVKIPETYEDLLQAVTIFKNSGIIPIAYNATAEGTFLYQSMVMKLGGKADTENPFRDGKINPCYIDAMKYMKELYQMDAFPQNAFTIDDNTRNNLFLTKKAAMIVQGSWYIGQGALDSEDKTVDMIPFPVFKEGKAHPTSVVYGLGNGNFHMSKEAWNDLNKREICIKLLKRLTSVETAKFFSKQNGFISNILIPDKELETSRLFNRGKEIVANSKELVGPTDSFIERNLWEDVLVSDFPKVLEGKITPEEVFEEIQSKMIKR